MAEQGDATITIVDDSGILGLVDVGSYRSFVSEDWTYEGLLQHFAEQMQSKTALVWECGDGGRDYTISVRHEIGQTAGFREANGSIVATGNRLYIASYTTLTMAAQFADETLPSKHEVDASIPVKAGEYRVRIVQMFDPLSLSDTSAPDFLIEIEPGTEAPWQSVAWVQT